MFARLGVLCAFVVDFQRWSPDGQFIVVSENQRVRLRGVIHRADGGSSVEMLSGIVGWLP